MDGNRIVSFPPIVDGRSRVLVLGTMPGAESLRRQQYYAYGRNHLWGILFALFGKALPEEYGTRVRHLGDQGIALWDVLHSCVRPGSADADIKHAVPNDIPALLDANPRISAVFLNGRGAEALFKKHIQKELPRSLHIETLPSTSPAYAIPFEKKLDGWRKLADYLANNR